ERARRRPRLASQRLVRVDPAPRKRLHCRRRYTESEPGQEEQMNAMPYHEAAEHNAAAHMRALGYEDARATKRGADGGIDVMASGAVAQVKMHMKPVGAPDLQRLYGARGVHHHRKMLFYSLSGYSDKAVAYAQ